MDGDHSFLLKGGRNDVENAKGGWSWSMDEVLDHHIDDRFEEQGKQAAEYARAVARINEPLPPGWRRMERGDKVFYLHESGPAERHRPIPDPGQFMYCNS